VSGKATPGNYFEDLVVGRELVHASPRTITEGDAAVYLSLTSSRYPLFCDAEFARSLGFQRELVNDLLVFHIVFGKTVPDISLNAVANLGYADCRFLAPVFPGDTLSATSEVIGLRQLSSGKAGVVYVRSTGANQTGEPVLDYVRWVMVRKRDEKAPAPEAHVPELPNRVVPDKLGAAVPALNGAAYDNALAGSSHRWGDYEPGETIDHVDGMTIEEAEHQMATRLFQNTARVHFNAHAMKDDRFAQRLVYGGHVISLARALSFNGLSNAFHVAGINAGSHVAPCFAGDTVHAWSEILEREAIPGRADIGALRVRTVATKDRPCADFPDRADENTYEEGVVLDLDYWVAMPR
jgi:2-methylfumaryl-CoA hydratase